VQTSKRLKNLPHWAKLALAVGSVTLLGSVTPVPGVLAQIKTLGELRVVTRSGPLTYYKNSNDVAQGTEYDLAQRFADSLGVRLKIIPVRSYAEIYSAVRSGLAHVAAAGLKVPPASIPGIAFGPPYQQVRDHLVYLRGSERPDSLADVGERDLEIVAGSAQAQTLDLERQSIPDLVWIENRSTDAQALLDGVAMRSIDFTIADSTEFSIARSVHPELRVAFDFPGERALAWAVSDRDRGLLRAVGDYFSTIRRTGDLTAIVNRYYERPENVDYSGPPGFLRDMLSRLPLYQKWFEEAARQSSQDWRLLAARGYQESKWDPRAASGSGARGLMQLTGHSAAEAQVKDLADPRQSIFGGARYFKQVLEKIPPHVGEPDRTWFALAAYNIGYGHLEDARKLTQKAGRDPDSWDDVRQFLPRLAEEYWYTQTENGYARGSEPVRYVDNVRGYRDLLESVWGGRPSLN
jgi:membrane-bound lytic murein transglycosylase F